MEDFSEKIKHIKLEDKAKLCVGRNYWQTSDIREIGLPSLFMADGPSGLRKQEAAGGGSGANQGMKASVCFPCGAAVASSWDKALLKSVGGSLGRKAAFENVDILLAPSMNIKRTPLCGRNFEYYSEDPYLCGELAAAFIEGVQEHQVAACPKHFALNNQETKRKAIDAVIGERELREIYLRGFELAVRKGKPWCIMSSYNRINGEFPAQNHHILKEILREEWGFDGVVISDWGAIDQIVPSLQESFSLQMPGDGGYSAAKITAAVRKGELKEEKLNEAAIRLLRLADRTGNHRKAEAITEEELHQKAYEAAAESMVLLKNRDNVLPLKKDDRLLVVGDMAVNPRYQVGGGSAAVSGWQVDRPLDCIRRLSPHTDYARGYTPDSYAGAADREDLLKEAMEKAAEADKVVVFAGLPNSYESEGYDRRKLDIPENQSRLIRRLSQCNKNIIIVLANGAPVSMPWLGQVKAVLESYLGGEAMGRAVAELLFGVKNPSGKLTETFPVRLEDTPAYLSFPGENNVAPYREGIFVGYRYYEKKKLKPLFPFGHGLSYTEFEYSDINLSASRLPEGDMLEISFQLKNTGDCFGKEVVQLYIGKKDSRVIRPAKELKAFEKIGLEPGEAKPVRFTLEKKDFAYYNGAVGAWITEPGSYQIFIGSSSRDILLKARVEVESADRVLLPITRNTAFGDIFDIPELNEIFMPFFDTLVANIPLEFNLGDKDGQLAKAMLRGMTFSSIASYEGEAAGDEIIGEIIAKLNERLDSLSGETRRNGRMRQDG